MSDVGARGGVDLLPIDQPRDVCAARRRLAERGWSVTRAPKECVAEEMEAIAASLGSLTGGRRGRILEDVVPREAEEAHPRSLSRTHGLGPLPLHVELSHRPRPCRYVLLGCVEHGAGSVGTTLLDWRGLALADQLTAEMARAPVLVRSGRRSFYSTLLPRCRSWLRFDRGCVEPVGARGATMLRHVSREIDAAWAETHRWKAGEILLIDNWRVLHGREAVPPGNGRRLLRMMVDG